MYALVLSDYFSSFIRFCEYLPDETEYISQSFHSFVSLARAKSLKTDITLKISSWSKLDDFQPPLWYLSIPWSKRAKQLKEWLIFFDFSLQFKRLDSFTHCVGGQKKMSQNAKVPYTLFFNFSCTNTAKKYFND